MCEGCDPSDHSLLPPIDVRVVSRWLSYSHVVNGLGLVYSASNQTSDSTRFAAAMFTLFQNQDLVNSPET